MSGVVDVNVSYIYIVHINMCTSHDATLNDENIGLFVNWVDCTSNHKVYVADGDSGSYYLWKQTVSWEIDGARFYMDL